MATRPSWRLFKWVASSQMQGQGPSSARVLKRSTSSSRSSQRERQFGSPTRLKEGVEVA